MKQLAVVSGKGGTGKTMVTGALASILPGRKAFADCDVDASNLELLLSPRVISARPYRGMQVASIDQDTCTLCGVCEENCRFDAISLVGEQEVVDPVKCEGCAVCTLVCPIAAVQMQDHISGEIFYSETAYGPLSHARLSPGSGTSGLLVTQVKQQAVERAHGCDLLLIDGPPGIGCPLIATVTGVDAVLVVTEPGVSGLHDLRRVVNVCRDFEPEILVAINKYTLSEDHCREIEEYCESEDLPVVGRIPFDETVIRAVREGRPVTDLPCPASDALREMVAGIRRHVSWP